MPHERSAAPHGFSIMELMIVVTILRILAAFEIPNLMRARMAANQAAAVANLKTGRHSGNGTALWPVLWRPRFWDHCV